MDPIPVLHLITRLIVGGAQENTMLTAALLDPDRFRVEVISGPQTGSEGSLIEEVRSRGVHLTLLPELVRQVSPLHDLHTLFSLIRIMRRGGYRIVHTHSSKAGILGRLAAHLAGVPVIVHTVHGWSFHDHMSPSVRGVYILLERLAARPTRAMIVVSGRDRETGLQNGIGVPEQYYRIRSAIPLEVFDPARYEKPAVRYELGIPDDAFVLGNVGRFSAQKDPLAWVEIAGRVGRALPGCRFLLVGDGPLKGEVLAALEREGIAGRTLLTGLRRDVPRLLAAMDVFLLTSLWEGLPRVIPQAMAMGIPVVATRTGGAVEAIRHAQTGWLVDSKDPETAAHLIVDLLHDPAQRQAVAGRAKAYARQEFDLRQMIAEIEALYDQLWRQVREG